MQTNRDTARARAADILCALAASAAVRVRAHDERLAAAILAQAQLAREREGPPDWAGEDLPLLVEVLRMTEGHHG